MIIQLIYASNATRGFHDQELDQLLQSAVRNNKKRNVRGLLLHSTGTFLQVLEGAAADADETFAIIKQDRRHKDINLVDTQRNENPRIQPSAHGLSPCDKCRC